MNGQNMNDKHSTQTNWVVITGAPSSGKTSVIDALAKRGLKTQDEVARDIISLNMSRGKSLGEIRQQAMELQEDILEVALSRELKLDPETRIFLDRGLPDSITYFRLAGVDGFEAKALANMFRYKAVFIFDRLPIVDDGVRTEDNKLAEKIDKMLEEDYTAAGYTPIRVPVMPIEDRANFVLAQLEEKTHATAG